MRWIDAALRNLFRGPHGSPRRSACPRPGIELLEDRLAPAASTFQSVIGLPQVQANYPYNGAGYAVAILDTGIDYDDPDLGGGFGPGYRVEAGWNFVANNDNPMDDNGHGTNIAGIIGSSNPADPGIDPDVNFIDLKVLNAQNTGTWSNIDQGLQWVIAHKTQYNIVAVNLSIGSGNYSSDSFNLLETDLANLDAMGVFTAVAAGNGYAPGSLPGLAYPAVDPDVVSVGATWAGSFAAETWASGATDYAPTVDQIVSSSQRDSALDLLAPGAWITSDGLNNTPLTLGGTSMATAVVSGAAVLLHQADDMTGHGASATQANLLALMQSTGVSIVDTDNGTDNVPHTGLTFKRLNLLAAVEQVGEPIAPPVLAPIANQTLPEGKTIVVPLSVSDPTGSPATITWTQTYLPALAWQLDQQYGFKYTGTYNTDNDGMDEEWIDSTANVWYCILPDGELRRWGGTMTQTLAPANLVALLSPAYWTNPALLWNAPYAGMPPTVFFLSGDNLSIRSPAPWLGTYSVTVSATDPHYTVTQTFNVTEVAPYAPPVLAAIPNQTMAHALHQLTLSLSASDSNAAPIAYSAQVLPANGQTPPVTLALQGNQLTISPALSVVGTFTVQVSASDGQTTVSKSFTVTVTDSAPVLAPIANVTASHGQDTVVTLSATDAKGDALTYSAQVLPVNGVTPPLGVSIAGTQLTIQPTQPVIGTFTIQVSVSDGALTATRTFTITLTNTAPTLGAIATQTMATGQTSLALPLSATDADHDALTFQAAAQTPSAAAYQLEQQYGFKEFDGSYYQNIWGQNEKWLVGNNNAWYMLLPNGNLYRWAQSVAATLVPANLIASLGTAFYAQPELLWNAQPPVSPALTFSFQGNQLTVQRPASLTGVFFINVSVSDGFTTTTQTFELVLN
jgi:hypothetical protein